MASTLLLVPLTAVVAAPRVYEASAVGSARNSYTDNKFDNTGSAAASLQQPWSTFSGNTIRAANILDAGAAISVAAGTSHVSVEHNKCAANVFVRLRPSRATAPCSLWCSLCHSHAVQWLRIPSLLACDATKRTSLDRV